MEVYLDYAAATPVDSRVMTAMLPYFTEQFFNPSAPYLAPKGHRGKPNQPAYVRDVAVWLADFYGVELAELAAATTANARRLFGI